MRALIAAAGTPPCEAVYKKYALDCDLLIAADAGIDWLLRYGAKPDVLLGDMDSTSLDPSALAPEIIKYPSVKDQTDMEIAVDLAIERGAKNVVMLGATGGRTDHLLGNLMLLLKLAKAGISALIADDRCVIRCVISHADFSSADGRVFSLLPFGGEATATVHGDIKYPVNELHFTLDESLGISNELYGESAELFCEGNILLVQSDG